MLRPGTYYTVTMVTEALGLQSAASRQAATGDYDLVICTSWAPKPKGIPLS